MNSILLRIGCISIVYLILRIAVETPIGCAQSNMVNYTVRFVGVDDDEILDQLRNYSNLIALRQQPPETVELLERRVERDKPNLVRVLRSLGYFSADLDAKVDASRTPAVVTIMVKPGKPFTLRAMRFSFVNQATPPINLPSPEDLGLRVGERLYTRQILSAQSSLLRFLQIHGYPLPEVTDRKVWADYSNFTAEVTFEIDPGRPGSFGATVFEGLETVDESYVRNRIQWNEGDPFNIDVLNKTQMNLIRSNLFSVARIESGTEFDEENRLPLTIYLNERKHRSVSAGARYRTDDGPGGRLGWEHRNLFGGGESFTSEAVVSGIEFSGMMRFKKPDFIDVDQTFISEFRIAEDNPDAYRSFNQSVSAQIERMIEDDMFVRGGLTFRHASISQLGETNTFGLVSVPAEFEWNRVDDILHPMRGYRLVAHVEPFTDLLDTGVTFIKSYVRYSQYHTLVKIPEVVLAGQVVMGSIGGASLFDLPADERFYAGGGGSIRGYPYQTASPLVGNHPVGGRSLFETSFEIRTQIAKNIGVVAFLDGGNAFESIVPDFSESLLWGAGIGLRYFTPVGPLRFDVGFPLNSREGIDKSFEIYISIGQSF